MGSSTDLCRPNDDCRSYVNFQSDVSYSAGIYCPAESASPNMTYSRQEGWMFYYEVLQFFYNDTLTDAELPTHWPDLKPGLKHWTIYDSANGNQDGCYMAPYAY